MKDSEQRLELQRCADAGVCTDRKQYGPFNKQWLSASVVQHPLIGQPKLEMPRKILALGSKRRVKHSDNVDGRVNTDLWRKQIIKN